MTIAGGRAAPTPDFLREASPQLFVVRTGSDHRVSGFEIAKQITFDRCWAAVAASPGRFRRVAGELGEALFLLPRNFAVAEVLGSPRRNREVGVIYAPESEMERRYRGRNNTFSSVYGLTAARRSITAFCRSADPRGAQESPSSRR